MRFWAIFALIASWICITDIKDQRIPNKALILLALLIEVPGLSPLTQPTVRSNLFALLIFTSGCAVNLALRGAVGMGDIKLLTLLAFGCGNLRSTLEILFYASALAWFWALLGRERSIPFGPPLIAGFLLSLIS